MFIRTRALSPVRNTAGEGVSMKDKKGALFSLAADPAVDGSFLLYWKKTSVFITIWKAFMSAYHQGFYAQILFLFYR